MRVDYNSWIGKRHKMIEILSVHPPADGRKKTHFLIKCDCGKEKMMDAYAITRGITGSCGCMISVRSSERFRKHGDKKNPIYNSWTNMRDRCNNPNNADYPNYGGRGIKVCSRWDDFALFVQDMGPRPPKHSLDRRNTDGDYEPENCRWADAKTQAQNQRRTRWAEVDGIRLCFTDWAKKLGVEPNALRYRAKTEGSDEAALRWFMNNDKKRPKMITFNGITKNKAQWSREFRVSEPMIQAWIDKKGSVAAGMSFLWERAQYDS